MSGCRFSLKTGGLIIGALEMIVGIIGALSSFLAVDIWITFGILLVDFDRSHSQGFGGLDHNTRIMAMVTYVIGVLIGLLIFMVSCSQTLIAFVLIYGIRKKSRALMTVWTYWKKINTFILVIVFVLSCYLLSDDITTDLIVMYISLIGINLFYINFILILKNRSHNCDGLSTSIKSY